MLNNGSRAKGEAPVWCIGRGPWYHLDAVNDGTHTDTECAPSAVGSNVREVGFRVERDGLVSAVVAGHVALSTVDTHVLINQSHHLLLVVQVTICPNQRYSFSNHILRKI